MNSDWTNGATSSTNTATRGESESSWKISEKAAAYLCSPVNETNYETTGLPWKEYYNPEAANYVIGSPSAEMYVKSYKYAYNGIITDNTKYPLEAKYRETSYPGYIYKINNAQSTISNDDYNTGKNSLDYTRYNSMYCGKTTNGTGSKGSYYWWLASPSAEYSYFVCYVNGVSAYLSSNAYCADCVGLCPLVSLKSGFQVQIEP